MYERRKEDAGGSIVKLVVLHLWQYCENGGIAFDRTGLVAASLN